MNSKSASTISKQFVNSPKIVDNPINISMDDNARNVLNKDVYGYERLVESSILNPIPDEVFDLYRILESAGNVTYNSKKDRLEIAVPQNFYNKTQERRITNEDLEKGIKKENIKGVNYRYKSINSLYVVETDWINAINNDISKSASEQLMDQQIANGSSLSVFFNKAGFNEIGANKTFKPYIDSGNGVSVLETIEELDLYFSDYETRFKNHNIEAGAVIFITKKTFNDFRRQYGKIYGNNSSDFTSINQWEAIPKQMEAYIFRGSKIVVVSKKYINEDIIIGVNPKMALAFTEISPLNEHTGILNIKQDPYYGGILMMITGGQKVVEDPFTNMSDGMGGNDNVESEFIQIYANGSNSVVPIVSSSSSASVNEIKITNITSIGANDGTFSAKAKIIGSNGKFIIFDSSNTIIQTENVLTKGVLKTILFQNLEPKSYTWQVLDSNSSIIETGQFIIKPFGVQ